MMPIEDYLSTLVVLYEDNHVIVVVKPPGVLSQKDATGDFDMTELVKLYLKTTYNKPGNVYCGLIHRLDRPVGGVMVFAKTSKAASRLSEDIRNHEFYKTYWALVEGLVSTGGTINLNIKKDEKKLISTIDEDGKPSSMTYRPITSSAKVSLLEVSLISGRFHQIRLSLSSIGHPIVNDEKYQYRGVKTGDELFLWCTSIRFRHPITKDWIAINNEPTHWPKIKTK